MSDIKAPPHSIESEQALIGALFIGGDYDDISHVVPDDFYRRDNRIIFAAIEQLVSQSKAYDAVTVGEYLESKHQLGDAGGLSYLAQLAESCVSFANIKAYADIVKKRAKLRNIIRAASEISHICFNTDGKSADEVLEISEQMIFAMSSESSERAGIMSGRDIVGKALDSMDERFQAGGVMSGLTTGFTDLDRSTQGLSKQDLIIIAGRPSMGKSAFSFGIMFNAAINHGKSVLGFSLEMPSEQLINRQISGMAKVNFERIRSGKIQPDEWPRISQASDQIAAAKIYLDETPALGPAQLRSRARKHATRHGVDLIVIDYLQLMRFKGERKDLEIAEITSQMKAMAKELDVPVILLSQLSREVDRRTDHRPVMSDLRDSGAIEQDADVIMFIYRDEVYNPETPDKGTAEILIRKQRNGPTGDIRLSFLGQYTQFQNYARDWL